MAKWLVPQTIKLTHIVEASSRQEAIEIAQDLGEHTADMSSSTTARQVKVISYVNKA